MLIWNTTAPLLTKSIQHISIISSYHDFKKTPDNLGEVLAQMDRFPAAIKKIATMANSSIDALRMLNFSKKYGIAGMCMGEEGRITRILGHWLFDSPLVYASIGKAVAPGQVFGCRALRTLPLSSTQ